MARVRRYHRPDEEPDVDERRSDQRFADAYGGCRCCGLAGHLMSECPYLESVQP